MSERGKEWQKMDKKAEKTRNRLLGRVACSQRKVSEVTNTVSGKETDKETYRLIS